MCVFRCTETEKTPRFLAKTMLGARNFFSILNIFHRFTVILNIFPYLLYTHYSHGTVTYRFPSPKIIADVFPRRYSYYSLSLAQFNLIFEVLPTVCGNVCKCIFWLDIPLRYLPHFCSKFPLK